MNRLVKYFLVLGVICFNFSSCERDDICPAAEPTTPFLIVQFFDFNDPENNKVVQSLSYVVDGSTDTISLGTTDSIALPINTNSNETKIQLISNTDNETFTNADTVDFIYQVNDVYINRACGFKATFTNFSAVRVIEDPTSDNWIRSISVEQINVENEENTHVFIFH